MLAEPVATETAMTATSAVRSRFTRYMTRRRSSRSTIAPAGRAKSSQGSVKATPMPATSLGSRVRVAARRGRAAASTPSPRFDTVLAVQSRQ